MSFYEKYDLTRLIGDGDAKTFRAVENSTGRIVFVHLFNPSGQELLGVLRSGSGAPVIEIGEFAGSSYAVTEVIEPFASLRDWVETRSWAGTPSAPPVAAPVAPAKPGPVPEPVEDEFAKLFQTSAAKTVPPPPPAAPAEPERDE